MKILLATDGSEFSRTAIEKCCQLVVKPENTEIRVLSVFENIYIATEPFAVSAEYTQALEAAERKQAEDFTKQAAAQLHECLPNANSR